MERRLIWGIFAWAAGTATAGCPQSEALPSSYNHQVIVDSKWATPGCVGLAAEPNAIGGQPGSATADEAGSSPSTCPAAAADDERDHD